MTSFVYRCLFIIIRYFNHYPVLYRDIVFVYHYSFTWLFDISFIYSFYIAFRLNNHYSFFMFVYISLSFVIVYIVIRLFSRISSFIIIINKRILVLMLMYSYSTSRSWRILVQLERARWRLFVCIVFHLKIIIRFSYSLTYHHLLSS